MSPESIATARRQRPLRIAVWHNLLSGGARRALFDHLEGLVASGHHVEVWCPPSADIDTLSLRPFAPHHIHDLHGPPPPVPGRQVRGPVYAKLERMRAALRALDDHCRACAAEINSGGFDVLFANSSSIFYNTPIGRHVRIPSLIFLQEPYRWLYEALPVLPWIAPDPAPFSLRRSVVLGRVREFFDTYALRVQAREELVNAKSFDRILVNSCFSRESVLRAYGLDSSVCYLGIDAALFQPTGAVKRPYVVGLGGVYPLKRLELAVRAVGAIPAASRPQLLWVGNFSQPDYEQRVRAEAQSLGVDLVLHIGIADDDLVKILEAAAVMIYTPQLEPFGLAPLEANACGTTVVAIAEGGIRETIVSGQNGVLLMDASPVELGQAIESFTSDLERAANMGRRAREHVICHWSRPQAQAALERQLIELNQSFSAPIPLGTT